MRFGTQVLLFQLACVIAVVGVCTAVFTWLGVQQLRAEAESSALSIARTVAADPDVRVEVERYSDDPGTPAQRELQGAPLAMLAATVEGRTGALFVVITDDHGIRLAHPDPERLGEPVSTSFEQALAGRETVGWETGTLGESARAKVPVFAPGTTTPVGEVSVGFAAASVFDDLPVLLFGLGLAALAALTIGAIVALLIRRRLERATLGLQPEELSSLVQDQAAVLDGVADGVLAYTPDGVVTVANKTAARLLGQADLVGRDIRAVELPTRVRDVITGPLTGRKADGAEPLLIGDRTVFIDTHRVERAGADLGIVAVIRDRTDVVELSGRLESVASMTNALRVQRHEFANRLHVAAGLIDADRVPDARAYLREVLELSSHGLREDMARLTEPFLRSLIEGKTVDADERGVRLRLGDATLVLGVVAAPEDVATVLANLLDNAIRAAVDGETPRWVEVDLLDDADTLVITVSDSGHGVVSPSAIFERTEGFLLGEDRQADADAVHGRGVGLPLIREIVERRGGAVWLADAGGHGVGGAVFCARLPNTMMPAAAPGNTSDRKQLLGHRGPNEEEADT